ncbi:MAG: KTSC domain-containing protein [Rhizobiales bacterium]|nr:KTSC domain-containing protein [Hyphomicrobiales bacterium]
MLKLILVLASLVGGASYTDSEMVDVAARGLVDLKPFACQDITRSSVIDRVCYDKAKRYLLIRHRMTYDQFCEIPDHTVADLLDAPSMGQFFRHNIEEPVRGAAYDCRPHLMPAH